MAVLQCVPCQGAPVGSWDGLGFSLRQLRRSGICGIVASKHVVRVHPARQRPTPMPPLSSFEKRETNRGKQKAAQASKTKEQPMNFCSTSR